MPRGGMTSTIGLPDSFGLGDVEKGGEAESQIVIEY